MTPTQKMDWLLNRLVETADPRLGYYTDANWAVFNEEEHGSEGKKVFTSPYEVENGEAEAGEEEMAFYLNALRGKGYLEPAGGNPMAAISQLKD